MDTDAFKALLEKSTAASTGEAGLPDPIYTEDQMCEYDGHLSKAQRRRQIGQGLYPAPVRISANRIGWRLSDIVAWQRSRPTWVPPDWTRGKRKKKAAHAAR